MEMGYPVFAGSGLSHVPLGRPMFLDPLNVGLLMWKTKPRCYHNPIVLLSRTVAKRSSYLLVSELRSSINQWTILKVVGWLATYATNITNIISKPPFLYRYGALTLTASTNSSLESLADFDLSITDPSLLCTSSLLSLSHFPDGNSDA